MKKERVSRYRKQREFQTVENQTDIIKMAKLKDNFKGSKIKTDSYTRKLHKAIT